MEYNWPETELSKVAAEITVGHVGTMADSYVSEGVPFLRSLNVEPFRINTTSMMFVGREFHRTLRKSTLRPGDVVIVRTGKPGACAVIPDWLLEANCSDLVIVRAGPSIRAKYIAYVVNSVAIHHVSAHTVGAVQQHFNVGAARTIRFLLPTLREQDGIISILGALDDKIDLNRCMNETLEAMARAFFQEWFVDFGPVRAKAEGRQPEGLSAEVAALFPDALDEEGKPEKWTKQSIYKVADVIYGAPFASSQFNNEKAGVPLIRIRDLANESPSVWTQEVHPKGYRVQLGDVVVGMDGEFRAHLWGGSEAWLNQRVCVFTPKAGYSSAFIRNAITEPLAQVEATEVATTVIHLGKNDIDRFLTVIPDASIMAAFGQLCDPIYKRIVANKRETRNLVDLRELLLPKLMSGEIRVKDAERLIEQAA